MQDRCTRLDILCLEADDTRRVGRLIGQQAQSGDVFALSGELGAGKTVFVQGLAEGMGIREPITSPTFTIVSHHRGHLDLFHIDAYRLEHASPDDLREIGLQEMLGSDAVCAIEWAEYLAAWLPGVRLDVALRHVARGRVMTVTATGPQFLDFLERLAHKGIPLD